MKKENGEENKRIIGFTTSPEKVIKPLLSYFSIVVMSFSEHKEELLGNFYEVGIFKDEVNANIVFQVEGKIRDAFYYFDSTFGITNIKYIKPYGREISEEKLKIVLDKLLKEKQEKLLSKDGKNKNKGSNLKDNGDNIFINQKKILEFKKDINSFIEEMKDFLPEAKKVEPNTALRLEDAVNNLLKYRNTTNTFKLAGVYKEAIELAETLYDKYFDYKKKDEITSSKDVVISEIDIVREYKVYQKVQRAKSLEKIDTKEFGFPWYEVLYYKIFGKFGINIKLILKEFKQKYELNYVKRGDVFNFIHFIIIFLIIEYSVFFVYKVVLENASISDQLSIYYILLNISSLGFIFSIGKFISKKSLFLSVLTMILVYLFFIYIKSYFGL